MTSLQRMLSKMIVGLSPGLALIKDSHSPLWFVRHPCGKLIRLRYPGRSPLLVPTNKTQHSKVSEDYLY